MSEHDDIPRYDVISIVTTTFEGRMSKLLTQKYNEGYELMYRPTYIGKEVPAGDTRAKSEAEPHFLVVLIRR